MMVLPVTHARVYVSASLSGLDDDWTFEPLLIAESRSEELRAVGEVSLVYSYGLHSDRFRGQHSGVMPKVYPPRGDLNEQFVRVDDIDASGAVANRWYGRIENVEAIPDGDIRDGSGRFVCISGMQRFTAYGLLQLLERDQVRSSVCYRDSDELETHRVPRVLVFNRDPGGDDSQAGNLSEKLKDGKPVFAFREFEQSKWTAREVVEYLLAHQVPQDAQEPSVSVASWELSAAAGALGWEVANLAIDGMTPADVLRQIIRTDRAHDFYLSGHQDDATSGPEGFTVRVNVVTATDVAVEIGGGVSVPANADTATVEFGDAIDIDAATIRDASNARFDQVIVEGRPLRVMFSQAFDDSSRLWRAWGWMPDEVVTAEAEVEALLAGDSEGDGYTDAEVDEQIDRNARVRSDERFRPVFLEFGFAADWDGSVVDPVTGLGEKWLVPDADTLASIDDSDGIMAAFSRALNPARPPQRWLGKTFAEVLPQIGKVSLKGEPRLPTKVFAIDEPRERWGEGREYMEGDRVHHDGGAYTCSERHDSTTAKAPGEGDEWAAAGSIRWVDVSQLVVRSSDPDTGRQWAVNVEPAAEGESETPRVRLEVVGAVQWMLGLDEWRDGEPAATSEPDDPTHDESGGLSWRSMVLTAAFDLDQRIAFRHSMRSQAAGQPVRQLYVTDDTLRFEVMLSDTVTGVDGGGELVQADAKIVRDDRERAGQLAKSLGVYFGRPRRELDLAWRQIDQQGAKLGTFITSVGTGYAAAEAVNTLVSAIDVVYPQSVEDTGRVQIRTAYAAVEAQSLVGGGS